MLGGLSPLSHVPKVWTYGVVLFGGMFCFCEGK